MNKYCFSSKHWQGISLDSLSWWSHQRINQMKAAPCRSSRHCFNPRQLVFVIRVILWSPYLPWLQSVEKLTELDKHLVLRHSDLEKKTFNKYCASLIIMHVITGPAYTCVYHLFCVHFSSGRASWLNWVRSVDSQATVPFIHDQQMLQRFEN